MIGSLRPCTSKAMCDPEKLFVLEVACGPDSLLTREVRGRHGLRAERCSHFNGFDLITREGIRAVLRVIDEELPENVWIATECSAFSPIQNMSQRNAEQEQRLRDKQKQDRVQHIGGIFVWAYMPIARDVRFTGSGPDVAAPGAVIDWWRRVGQTSTAMVSCCQVNMRSSKDNQLLGKESRIESTSASFAHHIHLPCPGEHCKKNHGVLEGKDTRRTAFYSAEFARRIVHHMLRNSLDPNIEPSQAADNRALQKSQDCRLQAPGLSL